MESLCYNKTRVIKLANATTMKWIISLAILLCFGDKTNARNFQADSASHTRMVFTTRELSRIRLHEFYSYAFEATDSSGKKPVYEAPVLPAWLQFDPLSHTISGKPTKVGQYPVHLTATYEKDTAHQYFMLTVANENTTNILCIGNSITNGTSVYNSYRRHLWQLLHKEGFNFDMIGSWSSHHMGGKVPDPDFDMDHDGHSGWNAQDIFTPPSWDSARGNIHDWLTGEIPQIVLIELGTNDVFQCRAAQEIIQNLDTLIGVLRAKNTAVKIFVAQIPPLGQQWSERKLCGTRTTYHEDVLRLNKAIANLHKTQHKNTSPVIIVDQFTNIDPATDMYDDIHPNTKGEKIMAQRWFDAIKRYLKKP